MIDTYNEIIRRLSRERNLTLLDTGYLTDPVWDYMPDWCHLSGLPGRLEALYFLEKLLHLNEHFQWKRADTDDPAQ